MTIQTIQIDLDQWAVVPRPDSRDWLDWVHAISDAIEESEYYVEPLLRSFLDHAPQPEQAQLSDDVLAAALDNLVHDNYERSQCGSKNRQADADLIRAALARAQQPAPRPVQASERLPTEADADVTSSVWAYNRMVKKWYLYHWRDVDSTYFSHWQPTGLVRPAEPDGGAV